MSRLHATARSLGATNPAAFRALPTFDQSALLADACHDLSIDLRMLLADKAPALAGLVQLVFADEAAGRHPALRHAALGQQLMQLLRPALTEAVVDELVELDHQTLRARA